MGVIIIKDNILKEDLVRMGKETFGDMVKAVVDVRQEILAIGGELHADEEVALSEQEHSKREDTWGINLYPERPDAEMIEFDSMVNLKPAYGNRSRGVEDPEVQRRIRAIVAKMIR